MCGFCGFLSKNNETFENLVEMSICLTNRGPDDHGEEISLVNRSEYALGLAHRRLSIFDLSKNGHQPMHSTDKRVSLVYNGEIYNFKELKNELSDYAFRSTSDTEVIIAAYLKWGIECVHKFNGMFAFALYDRETNVLFLVRDRIGKKPLYYCVDKGNIYFASELKSIMANKNYCRNINGKIIGKYLYRQYINAPESIFDNTYKLEPGTILEFESGKIKKRKYWDVGCCYNSVRNKLDGVSYSECLEMFDELLTLSVHQRMIADVQVGGFLSGGYDSSLICSIAQKISNDPIKTYSVGFYDDSLNEAPYAKTVAQFLGTNHTEHYISESEMLKIVSDISSCYDEPFADSSQICTMLISKIARKDVKVVLTGDAGDELFGGYPIYNTLYRAYERKYEEVKLHNMYLSEIGTEKFLRHSLEERILCENLDSNVKTQSGSGHYINFLNGLILNKDQNDSLEPIEDHYNEHNWVIRRMLVDMDTYLPGDILCKVDRASMRYGLEARCPFLDKNVMEFALSIPLEYKLINNCLKRMLKDLAYKYVPKQLLDRPKQGFSVPIERWLKTVLNEELIELSSVEFLLQQGIFDAKKMNSFVVNFIHTMDGGQNTGRNYKMYVWSFYVFQKWYQKYIQNR